MSRNNRAQLACSSGMLQRLNLGKVITRTLNRLSLLPQGRLPESSRSTLSIKLRSLVRFRLKVRPMQAGEVQNEGHTSK